MVAYAKSIAHEIKNALAGLFGPAQFMILYAQEDLSKMFNAHIKGKTTPAAEKKFLMTLEQMKKEGEKIFAKAEEIRIVAKTAEGTILSGEEEFEEFSFKVVWDAAVANIRIGKCRLVRELPDRFYPYGNVLLLQRVLVNLIQNAIEAMPMQENPEILLRGSYQEVDGKQGTYFELTDNGPGIPAGLIDKIFEQGVSTKPKPKSADMDAPGRGQGLWVCKRTIEEIHHGKLWVESEYGKGTTFKYWIPLKCEEN